MVYPSLEIDRMADLSPDPDRMRGDLEQYGVAVAHLGTAVTKEAMYALGEQVGTPMPENPPMSNLAYRGVVLRTDDIGNGEPLGMHVDLALKAPEDRPATTMLGCAIPLPPGKGGDTLLGAMEAIAASLTPRDREVLEVSRLQFDGGTATAHTPMLSRRAGGDHLTYWSIGAYGDAWHLDHPEGIAPAEADAAIAHLEASMRDPQHIRQIPWEPGLVVAWNNERFLHERTPREPGAEKLPREIYRVRLLGKAAARQY